MIEQILRHGGYSLGKKQKGAIYEIDRCPCCGKRHKAYVDIERDCAWCFSCNLSEITLDKNVGWVKLAAYLFFDEYDANPRDKDTQKRILKELDISGEINRPPTTMPEEKPKERLASLKTRDDTYRSFLENLGLTQAHEAHLSEIRGMSRLDIAGLGFKSMPTTGQSRVIVKKLLSSGYSVKGVPGFFYNDSGKITFNTFHQGILLPVLSPDGKVQGFQVKKDKPDPKYVFLSSGSDFMEGGTCAESWTHCLNVRKAQDIFITEGVLKGDVIYTQLQKQVGVIAIPGIHSVKYLDDAIRACRRDANFYLCLDMDKIKNVHVIAAEKEIAKHLAKQKRFVKIVRWPAELKGFDDYLLK
ncbi:MAG: DUF3854 domain-containing protein [Eubacteriaceae bacterium]|nr:DUF3854 domain-containing protein [Eubacteriaceae bacterium]